MPEQVEPDYWRLLFSSPLVVNQLESKSVGTTMKNLNLDILGNIIVPLPPSGEQGAICAQAQQAFRIVEQYGALEDARERLDVELPSRLHKSILQMAVQGRLVEQDPSDEPASALLNRIRAELPPWTTRGWEPLLERPGQQISPAHRLIHLTAIMVSQPGRV